MQLALEILCVHCLATMTDTSVIVMVTIVVLRLRFLSSSLTYVGMQAPTWHPEMQLALELSYVHGMDMMNEISVIAIRTIVVLRLQLFSSSLTYAGVQAPTWHPEMQLALELSYVHGVDMMNGISVIAIRTIVVLRLQFFSSGLTYVGMQAPTWHLEMQLALEISYVHAVDMTNDILGIVMATIAVLRLRFSSSGLTYVGMQAPTWHLEMQLALEISYVHCLDMTNETSGIVMATIVVLSFSRGLTHAGVQAPTWHPEMRLVLEISCVLGADMTNGILVIAMATIAVLKLRFFSSILTFAGVQAPTWHPEMRLVLEISCVHRKDMMNEISVIATATIAVRRLHLLSSSLTYATIGAPTWHPEMRLVPEISCVHAPASTADTLVIAWAAIAVLRNRLLSSGVTYVSVQAPTWHPEMQLALEISYVHRVDMTAGFLVIAMATIVVLSFSSGGAYVGVQAPTWNPEMHPVLEISYVHGLDMTNGILVTVKATIAAHRLQVLSCILIHVSMRAPTWHPEMLLALEISCALAMDMMVGILVIVTAATVVLRLLLLSSLLRRLLPSSHKLRQLPSSLLPHLLHLLPPSLLRHLLRNLLRTLLRNLLQHQLRHLLRNLLRTLLRNLLRNLLRTLLRNLLRHQLHHQLRPILKTLMQTPPPLPP